MKIQFINAVYILCIGEGESRVIDFQLIGAGCGSIIHSSYSSPSPLLLLLLLLNVQEKNDETSKEKCAVYCAPTRGIVHLKYMYVCAARVDPVRRKERQTERPHMYGGGGGGEGETRCFRSS